MRCFLAILYWLALLAPCRLSAQSEALAAYRAADFGAALPLLRTAHAASPGDPALEAALLSSLVHQDRIEEASDLDEQAASAFPAASEVLTARAEFAFLMADMPAAEKLFKAALKLKEENARAAFGLSQLCRAASLYRTARLLCLRAHSVNPDDALITRSWLNYVPLEKRKELVGPFAAAHPWLYKYYQQGQETSVAVGSAVEGKKIWALEGGPQETTLHFVLLLNDAQHARGVGLDLRLNNGRPLRMLFDTGASGILLKQSAVDKAGLQHLGSSIAWGIGDKGTRNSFEAVSDTCQIATLKFKTCLVSAIEGKGRLSGEEDGLIGADFFSNYLVEIDFEKHLLHLKPLPKREPDPQGFNRETPPDEVGWTPVFRFGHHLFVSTKVNDKCTGLFLLDTGSGTSIIDSTFARLSTKIRGDSYSQLRGLSGSVSEVFQADKAELQFARFRQGNLGLMSINLNNSPEPPNVRMSGILGLPVLALFHLSIDYRNGLVKFDYHRR